MSVEIGEILRIKILAHLSETGASITELSRRTAISLKILRSIVNEKDYKITLYLAIRILIVVAPNEIRSLADTYFPSYAVCIENDKNLEQNLSKQKANLAFVLQNRMTYVVHSLASTSLGTTFEEIDLMLGQDGLMSLRQLIDHNILMKDENEIVRDPFFETIQVSDEQILQMIAYNMEYFDGTNKRALVVNVVEGFSEKGEMKARSMLVDAAIKIVKLREDLENIGPIKIHTSILYGPILGDRMKDTFERSDRMLINDDTADLLAGLVHDMRAPFDGVLNFLENKCNALDAAPALIRARSQARQVSSMIRGMKNLEHESRVNRKSGLFFMDSILDFAENLAEIKSKNFTYDGPSSFFMSLDSDKVHRIIQNLLKNAFDAAKLEVWLSLVREGSDLAIVVKDDGFGINDELKDKMFERGFTNKSEGSGIGLSNAKRFAQGHGGDIVYERANEITSFIATLGNVFDTDGFEDNSSIEKSIRTLKTHPNIKKPVLFVENLVEAVAGMNISYEVCWEKEDLKKAWLVCTDSLEIAEMATASGVQRIWMVTSEMFSHPQFLSSLKRLADQELEKYHSTARTIS